MTQYHRLSLSKLISNKRCITSSANTYILLGTLQLVTKDNSTYPKGTILFEDATGKVPCFLIGYEKEWFTRTIALLSWSFLINKQLNGKENFHLEVNSEILFLQVRDSEALYFKESTLKSEFFEKRNRLSFSDQDLFQQFNSLTTATDILFCLSRNPTDPLSNVNLIAMVNMKSVLYQSENKTTFIVTLNEIYNPRSFVHIVFSGDHFIEYYKMIIVGEIYFFKDMKPGKIFNEKIFQSPVFEINSIDSIEYINNKFAIAYNSSNPAEQTQNSTDLACSCFGYEGIITYIIDNTLGLFVLDSEYILHLGKYLEYNPTVVPYRLGMKLLLHNIHAIKFTMDKDIWKLDDHQNCPNFRNVKVIFAACHCSTVQVIRFPSEIIESDSVSQKIIGKFSNFRNDNSFTLLELLWIQKVYSKKFPGEFEDQTLLGDSRPSKSDHKKVESRLFSRLLRKYRVSNHFQNWTQEYFNHKIVCRLTEENQEIGVRLPPISEVLQSIDELVFEIYGENQLKVFSQLEAKLEKTHLMGFLEGSSDGTLQLKDQTGKISVVNISFEKIQTHHLNNVWIIPEYELVAEPSKIYLRFDIEKSFCFYAKLYEPQFHFNQSVFQVRHIFPTKLNCPSENLTPSMNCKLQIETVLVNSTSADLTSELQINTLNTTSKSTFINLSGDFIKILPAIHVGLFYELSFDKSKQTINSKERLITFNLDNFATANNLQSLNNAYN